MSFSPDLFDFLADLAENNDRDWFNANKARYASAIKDPALAFIREFAPHLAALSPNFLAVPRASGGSMFRIHRDTRFSKDKRPYKQNTGLHFRHAQGKDAHAPGFYLHLEPGEVMMAVGMWRPDGPTTRKVRDAMVANPDAWVRARDSVSGGRFKLWGDQLKRAPRGYPADHPLVDDLRRKDFAIVSTLTEAEVLSGDFLSDFADLCEEAAPFARYLCGAIGLPY